MFLASQLQVQIPFRLVTAFLCNKERNTAYLYFVPKLNYSLYSLLIHNVPLILIFAGFRIRESHLTLAGEMFLTVDALSLTMKINEISCTDNDLCNVQNNAQQREQVPPIIFFSVRERAVFYKSCDLIGSGSGRYSPIRPAHSGRYPMRDESSITSLTSLQFFINYKYMLFTSREVRIGKNCARRLGYRPRP